MGRIAFSDLDKYSSSNSSNVSYFSLKNDRDVAKARILYDNIDDFTPYVVHEVPKIVNGKEMSQDVNCLRDYNDPIDVCPFCAAQRATKIKFFIPVYDERDGKTKIWSRSRKFASNIANFSARYTPDGKIVTQPIEIERNGAAGDKQTSYGIFAVGQRDNKKVSDFPEIPKVLGDVIWDKTADEMKAYLANGSFDSSSPVSRETSYEEAPRRRVPSTEDTF